MISGTTTFPKGIILDRAHTYALYKNILDEGISKELGDVPLFNTETVGDIISYRGENGLANLMYNEKAKQESLMALALFENVYLFEPTAERVGYKPPANLGVSGFLNVHDSELDTWLGNDLNPVKAKGVIVANERRSKVTQKGPLLSPDYPVGQLFSKTDIEDLVFFKDIFLERANGSDRYNPLYAYVGDKLITFIELACNEPTFIKTYVDEWHAKFRVPKKELIPLFWHMLLDVRDNLSEFRSLLHYSSDLNIPSTWETLNNFSPSNNKPEFIKSAHHNSDCLVAVRALLKEISYLPNPKTINEALEIRDSPEIRKLRSLLYEWVETARKGDKTLETQIRSAIEKTNFELKRAVKCKNVSGVSTLLALPISVIEMLSGMPPVASFALTSIGAGLETKARIDEWRNRWFIWNVNS